MRAEERYREIGVKKILNKIKYKEKGVSEDESIFKTESLRELHKRQRIPAFYLIYYIRIFVRFLSQAEAFCRLLSSSFIC